MYGWVFSGDLDGDPGVWETWPDRMPTESAYEGTPTGISLLQLAGVGIGDGCGSGKMAAGTVVTSSLLGKVAPPLRMDRRKGLAVVEFSLIPDSLHGAAISCALLLCG